MSNIHEIEGWIDLVQEEIIDPEREIIDPHHHLWHGPEDPPGIKDTYRYLLQDLWRDTSSGHNIKKNCLHRLWTRILPRWSRSF